MDGLETGVPHALRAGASETASTSARLRVLLIRHGESTNNVLFKTLEQEHKAGSISLDEARTRWFEQRSHDPDITAAGIMQAQSMAAGLRDVLREAGAVLACSPMKRALRTAQALAEALSAPVLVQPDMFEVGGIYGKRRDDGKGFHEASGFTPKELKSEFAFADTSLLPPEGPWNAGIGKESVADTRARTLRATQWLRSKATHDMVRRHAGGDKSDPRLVVVLHSDLIDLIMKTVLAQATEVDQVPWNQFQVITDNTSVSELLVPVEGADAKPTLEYVNRMVST